MAENLKLYWVTMRQTESVTVPVEAVDRDEAKRLAIAEAHCIEFELEGGLDVEVEGEINEAPQGPAGLELIVTADGEDATVAEWFAGRAEDAVRLALIPGTPEYRSAVEAAGQATLFGEEASRG